MKLVCIGDILITPEAMRKGAEGFTRYDEVLCMYFGAKNFDDFRVYQTKMEQLGSECEPLPEAILREIEDADVLQVHMAPVPASVFDIAKNLKIVASNRGGRENLNVDAATAHGIPVICNPAHNANAVAELAVALMLTENRNISRSSSALLKDKTWREKYPNSGKIYEMQSKTVGIMGLGNIGTLVAKKLINGFGTKVIACSEHTSAEEMAKIGVEKVTKEELLRRADIVDLHMRVSDKTYHMIGAEELDMMKDTAILINTARSRLIDTDALVDALKSGKIMGAALDVFDEEPLDPASPLLELDNVTLTSHQGGVTVNAFDDSPAMLLSEIERFFAGETPKFLQNPSVLSK